jgi:hypothetical protein
MASLKPSQVNVAIGIISGVSALLSILLYFERKKDRKLQSEILELDKTIKEKQLKKIA